MQHVTKLSLCWTVSPQSWNPSVFFAASRVDSIIMFVCLMAEKCYNSLNQFKYWISFCLKTLWWSVAGLSFSACHISKHWILLLTGLTPCEGALGCCFPTHANSTGDWSRMRICGSGAWSVFLCLYGRNRLVTAGQAQRTEVTASVESSEKMEGVWSDMLVFVKDGRGAYVT